MATPLPRRVFWVAWVAIMVVAGGEAALAWRDGNTPAPIYLSAVGTFVIWAVCGLLAWRLRPASRIGPLMLAVGVAFAVNAPWSFQLPSDYPLITVITVGGKVGLWLQLALIAHLFLTFPSGRPERGADRQLLVVAYVSAAVIPLALLLVQDPDWCNHLCGVGPLVIVHNPDIHRTIG